MQDLKISVITVTFNAERTITRCIESVIRQNFKNVEYIIIDGGSTDGTIPLINQYKDHINVFLTEPDKGIYDAMNKGLKLASGNVIGTLNADDYFAEKSVLSVVAQAFANPNIGIAYGDLDYVDSDEKVVRRWRSGKYQKGLFNWGWMPPHPTFYCKKKIFQELGYYRLDHGTAADYELMLRFIHLNEIETFYIRKVMNKMTTGGVSNRSYRNRLQSLLFDYKAMRNNKVIIPIMALVLKPLRKMNQYVK